MLKINDYRKSYSGTPVLMVPEMTLEPGAHWIRGENGAGKSTFFKSLAGLIPFDGRVLLNNIDLHRQPIAYRRVVNFAEAEPLYPEFITGKDLLTFIAASKNCDRKQLSYYISKFELESYLTKPFSTLSSGMLKKISLTAAFLGSPQLIILDEPFITLDESSRDCACQLIRGSLDRNLIVLISSHQDITSNAFQFKSTLLLENKTLKLHR